jgi:hypothetical protein
MSEKNLRRLKNALLWADNHFASANLESLTGRLRGAAPRYKLRYICTIGKYAEADALPDAAVDVLLGVITDRHAEDNCRWQAAIALALNMEARLSEIVWMIVHLSRYDDDFDSIAIASTIFLEHLIELDPIVFYPWAVALARSDLRFRAILVGCSTAILENAKRVCQSRSRRTRG